jgi:hypothetical protein
MQSVGKPLDKFMTLKKHAIFIVLAASLFSAGCSVLGPHPTPQPIFVTATPVAALPTDTATAVETPVLGPTPAGTTTEEAAIFPTLEPGTATIAPTKPDTQTPTFTLTYTDSPMPGTAKPAGTPVKCAAPPPGGFGTIFSKDANLQKALGCPVGNTVPITSDAQQFENGKMLWASQFGDQQQRMIYVVYNSGTFQRFADNWTEKVDPETTGETAPAGRNTPVRGFGKVWHNNSSVKNGLGWATNTEAGTPGQIQRFERGEMLFVTSLGQTFIFINGTPNSWRADATPF